MSDIPPTLPAPQVGRLVNGRHLGGRIRPAKPHTFAIERFNVNMAKIPAAPSSTSFRSRSAHVLGTCWANGPSNANPPAKVTIGDCTSEAGFHGLAFRQGIAGVTPYMPSVDQVIANYAQNTGYNGDPSTDSGADEVAVLGNAVVRGFPNGDKLTAFLALDPTNVPLRRSMSALFGGLTYCLETPDALMNAVPADAQANGTFGDPVCSWGTGTPDPTGGHCVEGTDLDPKGQIVVTWGLPVLFLEDGISELTSPESGGGCYAKLDVDLLAGAISAAPEGADWRALVTTWDAEGGNVPVPGAAAPPTLLELLEAALRRVGL